MLLASDEKRVPCSATGRRSTGIVGWMANRGTDAIAALRDLAYLVRTRTFGRDPRQKAAAGHALAARFANVMMPGFVLGDDHKSWFDDEEFLATFDRVCPGGNRSSAERKFFLRSLLSLLDDVPGDTAECGVWTGGSSWFICKNFEGTGRTHHGFDSFDGLSEPDQHDGEYWRPGDLSTPEAAARQTLQGFSFMLYEGWIPERFDEVADTTFCFVHVDVDLYQPTRDSIEFFYPRVAPGGIMLFDDYGSRLCPGARRAVDDAMAERPEPLVHVPTMQAFIVKSECA
jgi:O-methyltransferase